MIRTYDEFLSAVQEVGMMSFGGPPVPGFPSLSYSTLGEAWHTGNPDTDPWQWKRRALQDRVLAFGCFFSGHKGFLSPGAFPLYYAAMHPGASLGELYLDGLLPRQVVDLYALFDERPFLSTADIRKSLGVRKKEGLGQADRALVFLQRAFYVSVCGEMHRVSREGKPYGWPVNAHCKTEIWYEDLILRAPASRREAVEGLMAIREAWQCPPGDEAMLRLLRPVTG